MTQKIKSWKEKVSIFFQNLAKKELETEKETAKQSIIHILIKDKTNFKFNPKPSYCVAYVTGCVLFKTTKYYENI